MVKIGVLSDTHITDLRSGLSFLETVSRRYFEGVDMILHAGDMVDPDIMLAFEGVPVHAVRGNMDPPVIGVPDRKVIEVQGFRIGLIHGWGPPDDLETRVLGAFAGEALDCLVYGHSHFPACHSRGGVLFFNPGSPTDRRRAPCHTVGLLEIGETIEGRIFCVDDCYDEENI